MKSALGMTPEQIKEIAQDVPSDVKRTWCSNCLWASIECRSGSYYAAVPEETKRAGSSPCAGWDYYD